MTTEISRLICSYASWVVGKSNPEPNMNDWIAMKYNGVKLPGDSIRDLLIPDLEVTNSDWKGHVNSPSQKGHQQNHQVIKLSWSADVATSPKGTSSFLKTIFWNPAYLGMFQTPKKNQP